MLSYILEFIIDNYLLIVILSGLIMLLTNSLNTIDAKKHDRIKELLIVVVSLSIAGSFKVFYSNMNIYVPGSTIAYFMCFTLRPAVIVLFASILSKKKYVKYLSLLSLVNSIIYIIGLFNGMTYSFTANNQIIMGPLYYTSHLFCAFYFLVLLYVVLRQHNRQNKIRTYVLLSIMLVSGLASLFDILYYEVNLFDIVTLMCGVEYYIYLYISHNKIDVLTGTFNRASFYADAKKIGSKVTSVISIDMNDLKKINDTMGHDEGDKAISAISRILLNVDDKNVRIYRVGGDEFVALCFYKVKENVENFIKEAKKELNETEYNCSFGYAYKEDNDIFETYKKADEEMYKDKEIYHKEHGRYR